MSEQHSTSRRQRALDLALRGASRVLGRDRLHREGGGDPLILDAQRVVFQELYQRFTERASRGEGGLGAAVDALDAMWRNIRHLRAGASTIVGTLTSDRDDVHAHVARFYAESTALLQDAIIVVFAEDLGQLALPPDRMAVIVRVVLEGLIVELAQAHDAEDVAIVDQAYADVRALFQRFVLTGEDAPPIEPITLEPIPLPW